MAVVGKEHVRITAPWVSVTQAAIPYDSKDPDHGGSLLAGENRDVLEKGGKSLEIYTITANVFPSGPRAAKRVVTALEAQGYQVVEDKERSWVLELVDAAAPEDAGESETISVARPAMLKFFDWLQRRIDQKKRKQR